MESLIDLCRIDAIAGNETNIRRHLVDKLSAVADEVLQDGLGSVIFRKQGNGPKVLFMAHMDEVGFIVKGIDGRGSIHIVKIGGVLDAACHHQIVRITTRNSVISGLLNTAERGGEHQYTVDIGVDTLEEARELGIQVGDMVCFASEPIECNNRIFAKALDDRIGCYAMMEAMKHLEHVELQCDAYFAFTSSEEVGTRGGKTATHLVNPEVSFSIDVASEKKGLPVELNTRQLGNGFLIINFDKTLSPRRSVIQYLRDTAEQNHLIYQNDMLAGGGTDAGSSHLVGSGRLSAALGIPLRECHGPYSLCDMGDVSQMIQMIEAICKTMNETLINTLKEA